MEAAAPGSGADMRACSEISAATTNRHMIGWLRGVEGGQHIPPVRTVSAGLHSFLRMSKQIAPVSLLMFGCQIFVSYFIWCKEGALVSGAERATVLLHTAHLRWHKWVVRRKPNINREDASFVWRADWAVERAPPVHQVCLIRQLHGEARSLPVLPTVS